MKQQVAVSLAGLMLLTSGCENAHGKIPFSALVAGMQTTKSKKTTFKDVGEKNIHNQWQGKSNPTLYDGGFFVRADFLYWRADEEGLEYGSVTNRQPSLPENSNRLKAPSVKWDPGFRIGVGYTFSSQDYWDLAALWTHFTTHQSDSKSFNANVNNGISGTMFVPGWGTTVLGTLADKASVHWNLRYNVYDLDLGRNYFVSKTVSVHPFVGVRGATINQGYRAKYNAIPTPGESPRVPTSFKANTNFWGIGAHIGTALQWHINSSFSFLGNVGGSLLYGDFKIKERYHSLTLTLYPIKNHITTGTFNIDAMLGFQWEKFFYQNRYRLSITAGYEWNEWFSQNRMIKLDTITSPGGGNTGDRLDREKGDLMLQGANLQLRWDF